MVQDNPSQESSKRGPRMAKGLQDGPKGNQEECNAFMDRSKEVVVSLGFLYLFSWNG